MIKRPEFRAFVQARALVAGQAARAAYRVRAIERGARYASAADAYRAGYAQGYATAARWWRRKLERDRKARSAAA